MKAMKNGWGLPEGSRIAIYARSARAVPDAEPNSVASQCRRLEEIAGRFGYKVAGVYSDVGSGLPGHPRPGLSALMRDAGLADGPLDAVAVTEPGRVARHFGLACTVARQLERLGIPLVSAEGGRISAPSVALVPSKGKAARNRTRGLRQAGGRKRRARTGGDPRQERPEVET